MFQAGQFGSHLGQLGFVEHPDAVALEQATMHGQEYITVEELQQASGVAQSVLDKLRAVGALGNLPETSQVDLFSMM